LKEETIRFWWYSGSGMIRMPECLEGILPLRRWQW